MFTESPAGERPPVGQRQLPQPWLRRAALTARLISIAYIVGAVGCAIAAFAVLRAAAGSAIASWTLSPTVYLSILATVSAILLRTAFRRGADTAWWAHLMCEDGVPLRDLHSSWKVSHSVSLPFIPSRSFILLRMTATAGLLLGVVGPLLQRAVVVVQPARTFAANVSLPIRIQPMWNLTVSDNNVAFVVDMPLYQPEFAQIVLDQYNHVPARIPSGVCPPDATCASTVTVAGFQPFCSTIYQPWQSISKFIGPICTRQNVGLSSNCTVISSGHLQTLIQLATGPNTTSDPRDSGVGLDGDGFDGSAITYQSYIRADSSSDILTVQNCTFNASYINLPIVITNGTNLALDTQRTIDQAPSIDKLIYMPKTGVLIGGFIQAMGDFFGGYNIYDSNGGSQYISGIVARAYVNQSTIAIQNSAYRSNQSYLDPLPDFTTTVNELSLRYAVAQLPTDPDRLHNWQGWVGDDMVLGNWTQKLAYPISDRQTVTMQRTQQVAEYDVDYKYLIIAMGFMAGTAILMTTLVVQGWTTLGRSVSTSPLEIAKAFNAPMLKDAGTNVSGGAIAQSLENVKVRYGELLETTIDRKVSEKPYFKVLADEKGWPSEAWRTASDLSPARQRKLGIAPAGEVIAPRDGLVYH